MTQRSARCRAARMGVVAACIVTLTSCHTLQTVDSSSKNRHPAPTCMDLVTLSSLPRSLREVPIVTLFAFVLWPVGFIVGALWYDGADAFCLKQAGSADCHSKLGRKAEVCKIPPPQEDQTDEASAK